MAIPTNDARALHNVLEAVGIGEAAIQNRWVEVLDAQWGTVEFAQRHGEVAVLFNGALTQISSLPDTSRQRFERYAWNWWLALVAPPFPWQANTAMNSVVDPASLDQLGSAADVIEARMHGSLAAPNETNLDDLRGSCQEWIDALVADDELPQALRMNLLQDLRHVTWLIENAKLFGAARVAAAGQAAIGNIVAASDVVSGPKRGEWVARGKKTVNALIMIGALYQGVNVTLSLGEGAAQFLGELTAGSSDSAPLAPGVIVGDAGTT